MFVLSILKILSISIALLFLIVRIIRNKAARNATALILSFCCSIAILEVVFRTLNLRNDNRIIVRGDYLRSHIPDRVFGYTQRRPGPDHVYTSSKTLHEETRDCKLYDVTYRFDSFGRRVVPNNHFSEDKRFCLFFGCSYAVGEGVNDQETLPYYFIQLDPSFVAYNYGLSGYGPQQMVKQLEQVKFGNEIKVKDGICVYVFIEAHIHRVISCLHAVWTRGFPAYEIDQSNHLVEVGTFQNRYPVRMFVYDLLNKSSTIQYLIKNYGFDYPMTFSDADYELTARIIERAYQSYSRRYNSNFYMIIYPGQKNTIQHYIRNQDIKILDYSKLFPFYEEDRYHIPFDNHPTPLANRIVMEQFHKDVFH